MKIKNMKLHDAIAIALAQLRQVEEACGHSAIYTVGEPNAPPPIIYKLRLKNGEVREFTTKNIRAILAQYLRPPCPDRLLTEEDRYGEIYNYILLANQLYQQVLTLE